ncbi:hypothetical protein TWF694_006314 [Orbilia ellipsospora]|uniref:Uncharacterized protein n=1 Tax=Orbilia ellipsospora TaxID=2528407 RepID=A0AAV9XKP3_9PEZI
MSGQDIESLCSTLGRWKGGAPHVGGLIKLFESNMAISTQLGLSRHSRPLSYTGMDIFHVDVATSSNTQDGLKSQSRITTPRARPRHMVHSLPSGFSIPPELLSSQGFQTARANQILGDLRASRACNRRLQKLKLEAADFQKECDMKKLQLWHNEFQEVLSTFESILQSLSNQPNNSIKSCERECISGLLPQCRIFIARITQRAGEVESLQELAAAAENMNTDDDSDYPSTFVDF